MIGIRCCLGAALCAWSVVGWAQAGGAPASDGITPQQLADGSLIYAQHCTRCHGANMVDPGSGVAYDLRKFPKTQRSRFVNSVTNGKNAMPPWRNVLTPEQISALWAYVVLGENSP